MAVGIDTCVACEKAPANSDEHVFQSALGGRLSYRVLCKACNEQFGRSIDKEVIDAYHGFRVLLGIEGDHGQVPSMRVTADDGREFIIESRGKPRLLDRAPELVSTVGIRTHVRVNSVPAARQFIRSRERKNPNPALVVAAERILTRPGMTDYPISYGGEGFYRSTLKSGLVLMAGLGAPYSRMLLNSAWEYVNGGTQTVKIISMPAGDVPWYDPSLGEIPHLVSIQVRAGLCRIDVRHFRHFATLFEFELTDNSQEWSASHGVDPLTGKRLLGTPQPFNGIPQDQEGEDLSMEYAVTALQRAYLPRLHHAPLVDRETRIDAPDLVEILNKRT